MRIKNQELISRSTKLLGRSLILLAATNLLLTANWINTDQTALLGVHFRQGRLGDVIFWALVATLASYVVSWWGDHASSAAWNIEGLETAFMYFGGNGQSKIDKLHARFEVLLGEFERKTSKILNSDDATSETVQEASTEMKETLTAVRRDISELTGSVRQFNFFRLFYVWIWHLLLPIGFTSISLLITLCG